MYSRRQVCMCVGVREIYLHDPLTKRIISNNCYTIARRGINENMCIT